jgi:hypothetical protein
MMTTLPAGRTDKLKLEPVIVDRQRRHQEWTCRSSVLDETVVDRSSMTSRPQEEATPTASAGGGQQQISMAVPFEGDPHCQP